MKKKETTSILLFHGADVSIEVLRANNKDAFFSEKIIITPAKGVELHTKTKDKGVLKITAE